MVSEFASVCFSKDLLKADEILSLTGQFIEALGFSPVGESTIRKAIQVKKKMRYSFWDCLIIASALENDCSVVYTEDMQDGQASTAGWPSSTRSGDRGKPALKPEQLVAAVWGH